MRLLFLGTAAAEGYPGIFCKCARCQAARALGGRDQRYRSSLLINDDLLIDFGPDLLAAAQRFNCVLADVTTGLVTHAHSDHFYLANFEMRKSAFTGGQTPPTLNLFAPEDVTAALAQAFPDEEELRMRVTTVHAFDAWGHGGYSFTAFRANHALEQREPLFYSIAQGPHAVLYATDSGPFPEATWQALAGRSFDVIIMEETLGGGKYNQHMGFATYLEHAERMRAQGMLRPGGRLFAHHFSHSGNPVHAELEAFFAPYGVEVAYDGLVVEL